MATAVVAQVALFGAEATAGETPLWQVEVAKIPTTEYTRDAKIYVTESCQALSPYVEGGLGDSRLAPVLADVESRYFDGARLKSAADGEVAFDNLKHLESFLKSRLTGASPPNGEAEQAHVRALVKTLTGARLLADAAIQDAEVTIGPFRASPPPAPAPVGLTEAFADLEAAKVDLAKADEMLVKANPVPATIQAGRAWASGFNVLARLGITYAGDHDNDGVVDVVELRLGASPLLVDTDGDGLTDKFEITELAGWTAPNKADTDGDSVADGAEDVDNDGLTNLQEQDLGTSPTNPDTDGDGAKDGTEVAQGSNPLVADQPRAPPTPGDVPPIVPVPTDLDTDGDGAPDIVEEDDGTNANNPDTEGDGLSDGTELEWGSSSLAQDTDGDGLRDDYEVANAESQDLDPARPDEQISKWTYVADFALGLVAGEFAMRDSMAWLAGNICSTALSFIPVYGWIVGAITDIRDAVAAAIRGDWVSAGFSVLSLIPYAGDAVAIPAKIAKFVQRYVHRLAEVARFVARYDKIPASVKEVTYELIMPEVWAALVEPEGLTAAVASGRVSKSNFDRLLRGARTDLKKLHEVVFQKPNHVHGPNVDWVYRWTQAEERLVELMTSLGKTGRHGSNKLYLKRPDLPDLPANSRGRYPDFAEEDANGNFTLHEVKAGIPMRDEDIEQCKKDGWYKDPANQAKIQADNPGMGSKKVVGVHWHFMPHGGGSPNNPYNSLGVWDDLLDCLVQQNITFTIHFPAN
ncbi:hypothetical protein [Micromonospora cremea]|uniref:hypothetical protein n=1 Tax=Micromonospora cremea TaxID=709881 RepID=UPI0009411BAE|nr:hypothetical protein [Micromonospora cremea]